MAGRALSRDDDLSACTFIDGFERVLWNVARPITQQSVRSHDVHIWRLDRLLVETCSWRRKMWRVKRLINPQWSRMESGHEPVVLGPVASIPSASTLQLEQRMRGVEYSVSRIA